MRFIVEYTRPTQTGKVRGVKMFDVRKAENVNSPGVQKAAEHAAGHGATIVSLKKNDGRTDLGERVER